MKEDVYLNVPGRGKYLEDGTWWTNSNVPLGFRGRLGVCIERQVFDGRWFCKWRRLP